MLKKLKKFISGLVCLLLGGSGLWFCATGDFEKTLDSLPDYNYLEEIRGLEKEKRLGEAEHLADWVLEGDDVASREEIQALRDRIHKERTSFWKRAHRAGKGFVTGNGVLVEELGGAVVSDFLLWGDIRDLAKQGYYKVTGKETDAVVASLAAVGIATSLASYIPEPAEGAEVSVEILRGARGWMQKNDQIEIFHERDEGNHRRDEESLRRRWLRPHGKHHEACGRCRFVAGGRQDGETNR